MDDTPLTQPEKISELQGDPSRQAVSLFKGIDYQIWQTVLAWMDLGENEILVVEGAEDFDNLSGPSATVNQVKNLASPISLRSECVCDALRNFWIARHKNPGRTIRFRLIALAATILLAAGDAVTVTKMGSTLGQLQKLAEQR